MSRCLGGCCGCCCSSLTWTPLHARQLSWHDDVGVQPPRLGKNLILHVWCCSTRRHIRHRHGERAGHHDGLGGRAPRLPSGEGPDQAEGFRPGGAGGHDGGYLRLSGGDGVPPYGAGIMGRHQHRHRLRLGNRWLVL